MRVLLDESLPRGLAALIAGHDVSTVVEMGWSGMENGQLLERASEEFDAFVTIDANLPYQQGLKRFPSGSFSSGLRRIAWPILSPSSRTCSPIWMGSSRASSAPSVHDTRQEPMRCRSQADNRRCRRAAQALTVRP